MTNSDFPFCTKAGLTIFKGDTGNILTSNPPQIEYREYVLARDIEGLLANAPVVYGYMENATEHDTWSGTKINGSHTARLLLIEELKQEPEEIKLLRELMQILDLRFDSPSLNGVTEKAKAFLARRDGGE